MSPRGRSSRKSISLSNGTPAALTFADQRGDKLVENHFVEHLHYSDAALSAQGQMETRSCCVVS
jgi:hypothetical protein